MLKYRGYKKTIMVTLSIIISKWDKHGTRIELNIFINFVNKFMEIYF